MCERRPPVRGGRRGAHVSGVAATRRGPRRVARARPASALADWNMVRGPSMYEIEGPRVRTSGRPAAGLPRPRGRPSVQPCARRTSSRPAVARPSRRCRVAPAGPPIASAAADASARPVSAPVSRPAAVGLPRWPDVRRRRAPNSLPGPVVAAVSRCVTVGGLPPWTRWSCSVLSRCERADSPEPRSPAAPTTGCPAACFAFLDCLAVMRARRRPGLPGRRRPESPPVARSRARRPRRCSPGRSVGWSPSSPPSGVSSGWPAVSLCGYRRAPRRAARSAGLPAPRRPESPPAGPPSRSAVA